MKFSRESTFSFLDEYVNNLKGEIDTYKTRQPLLKSYIFETFNEELSNPNRDLLIRQFDLFETLKTEKISHKQIDEELILLGDSNAPMGFLEVINKRFFVIYSIETADSADKRANNFSKNSPFIDSLWISGKMFNSFLNKIGSLHHPNRYIKMNFEYFNLFTNLNDSNDFYIDDEPTKISLSKELGEITEHLDKIKQLLPEFNSITSMKFPTLTEKGRGGHLFYHNGKVTNRSNNFLDHRYQIKETVRTYQNVTEHIENSAWVDFELIKSPDLDISMSFRGSPVVFKFKKQLPKNVLFNFTTNYLSKGKEPFKILAEPKWISEERVHLYGLDLHLWQEVMLDFSLKELTVFLPRGTCGNTIHRLTTNLQRFLEPDIEVWVGNERYENIINKNLYDEPGGVSFV